MKLVLATVVTILVAVGATTMVKSFFPGAPAAGALQTAHGSISPEEVQRQIDVKSLPVVEIAEPY
jgi:hypothetical protein